MTKCYPSIVILVSHESLICDAPLTNQGISQYARRCRIGLTPFSQAGMIGVL